MIPRRSAICVDSRICSIGSAHIDIRSVSINYPTNPVIYDERVTRKVSASVSLQFNRVREQAAGGPLCV
jgi:cardiolipin synthase